MNSSIPDPHLFGSLFRIQVDPPQQAKCDSPGSEKDHAKAAAELRDLLSLEAPRAQVDATIAAINNDWFRQFFDFDPTPTLRQVRCPVLALDGSLDLQVSAAQNLPPIRAALAGNPDATVEELPGLNHLFQTARTGAVVEYGVIEETLSPLAMDTMTRWILARTGRPGPN